MTHLELRKKYLDFFAGREHKIVPSAPIVPENDPTTLFTGSGMQPIIPYLLGESHPLGKRLVDIQKCFRGQDIDEVGDNRHDTFFEMMGNWSLGDYFKEEQIKWYFEFLTKELGLDQKRFYVTCFEGNEFVPKDTESVEIWRSLGIPEEKIYFYSGKSNWWSRSGPPEKMPAGEIGGPNTEVFYDFQIPHNSAFGEKCHPNCDCGRFIEIGNSVFITYQKQADGSFKELSQKNVDFGGGLERTLAALGNEPDIFKTNIFSPIIETLEKISNQKYLTCENVNRNFRIVADHIKAAVFLISAGVQPSNKDRGYILRRLIRRSIRYSRYLNIKEKFIEPVSRAVFDIYGSTYPEILEDKNNILQILDSEESKFQKTIENGLKELEKILQKENISSTDAFYLYESFGFPFEMTEEEAKNKNITVANKDEFNEEVKKHQEASRTAAAGMFKGGLADHSEQVTRYHTATHLLQAALRRVLGEHVHQEGSNITGERLRFDFSHSAKLTEEEIKKVQELVNDQIQKGLEQKMETMAYEEALKSGAMAFFKERYPEKVTVYSFIDPSTSSGSPFSREICGGPHVKNTRELGCFEIFKEESAGNGIRRIYAKLH